MYIGVVMIRVHLWDVHDLKSKRRIVRSLKDGLRAKFNVSVAEVEAQDVHQEIVMGLSSVSGSGPYLEGQLSLVLNHLETHLTYDYDVIDMTIEKWEL